MFLYYLSFHLEGRGEGVSLKYCKREYSFYYLPMIIAFLFFYIVDAIEFGVNDLGCAHNDNLMLIPCSILLGVGNGFLCSLHFEDFLNLFFISFIKTFIITFLCLFSKQVSFFFGGGGGGGRRVSRIWGRGL